VGASSSESTSASVSDFAAIRPIFGMAICAVGIQCNQSLAHHESEKSAEARQLAGRSIWDGIHPRHELQ